MEGLWSLLCPRERNQGGGRGGGGEITEGGLRTTDGSAAVKGSRRDARGVAQHGDQRFAVHAARQLAPPLPPHRPARAHQLDQRALRIPAGLERRRQVHPQPRVAVIEFKFTRSPVRLERLRVAPQRLQRRAQVALHAANAGSNSSRGPRPRAGAEVKPPGSRSGPPARRPSSRRYCATACSKWPARCSASAAENAALRRLKRA
jgi:hypothetical protein